MTDQDVYDGLPERWCPVCGAPLPEDGWASALCEPCGARPCLHGNPRAVCDRCDRESDRLYDEWREGRG